MDNESTIDIQSDELIEVLKLVPVLIPGWVTPVKPSGLAHGGIPRRLFSGTPENVRCVVDPWTLLLNRGVATLAEYESVELFINAGKTPVCSAVIEPGEENKRVALYAPKAKFINGINKLHYVVKRLSGNEESSDILHVLYHLHPHANFKLIIPSEVIAYGVTAELAKRGVTFEMSYTTKEPFDQVQLQLGNATFMMEVTDPSAPVSVTLYTDDFENFIDGEINANFEVTDQLGNFGESPNETLNIRLKEENLPPPTLTNVLDSNNNEVPEGASTISTKLILKGTASKGREVEIFDGSGPSAVSKGKVTASSIDGVWQHTITITVGGHRLYAKSLYHPTPVYSNVRNLTAVAAPAPTLTSARGFPSGTPIANNGSTFETSVTLSGTAAAGQKVEILDGITPKGQPTADETTGVWQGLLSGLGQGPHVFKARALYGQEAESATWTVTVAVDTWRDSITDFNGNAGNWALGSASRTARILNGYYENYTYDVAGNSGILLSQTFQFDAARTYSFSYRIANVSPQPDNQPPRISVSTSSGLAILGLFVVPRNGAYYEQTASFRVPVSGPYTIYISNHEDRGGYGGANGGNDFHIDYIHVRRI